MLQPRVLLLPALATVAGLQCYFWVLFIDGVNYLCKALLTRPELVQGIHSTGRTVVFNGCTHLISKYDIVYTNDPPARINYDRI
jgi:hypothetical protein